MAKIVFVVKLAMKLMDSIYKMVLHFVAIVVQNHNNMDMKLLLMKNLQCFIATGRFNRCNDRPLVDRFISAKTYNKHLLGYIYNNNVSCS